MAEIETREALPADMEKIKELWVECFGDSREYADYIFGKHIKPGRAFLCAVGGEIASMLFYEPFTLKASGDGYRGAYVYGVATALKHRGMGLSTKLLEFTHKKMPERGYALSILVPASESLFDFYGKRGYSRFSDICRVKIKGGEIQGSGSGAVLAAAKLEGLYDTRESFFADSKGFVSWSEEYLKYIGGECEYSGGGVLRFSLGAEEGYAVCYRGGKNVYIKEMAVAEELLLPAMRAIHGRFGAEEYHVSFRADFKTPFTQSLLPLSMVKWYYNSEAVLSGLAPAYIAFVLD